MIIEQIRYFIAQEAAERVIEARRVVSRIREESGLPPGQLLVADAPPDDGPLLIWQCAYENEDAMAVASTMLIGHADYEAARDRLGGLVQRVELEVYVPDEDAPEVP